jgi:hypothetical protein
MNGDFEWVKDVETVSYDDIRLMGDKDGFIYRPKLTNEIFNEIRGKVISEWNTYDNQFGYVDEKLEVVNNLPQEWDSVIQMFRMFHHNVRCLIIKSLTEDTKTSFRTELSDRKWGEI